MDSFLDINTNCSPLSEDYTKNCKTVDKVLDLNTFPFLNQQLKKQRQFTKSIRLLYIFGASGQNALFVTDKDVCYVIGNNRYGCLAIGSDRPQETTVKINSHLSNRKLIDICSGAEHCLALNADGKCYSWGSNHKGQLGIDHKKICYQPLLVRELSQQKVIQISCGSFHSMALTSEGQVYSWGYNNHGQLGVGHYDHCWTPTLVDLKYRIVSISCGWSHSLGVTADGVVYIWGNNQLGQLCIPKEHHFKVPKPIPLSRLKSYRFKKAICGSDYTHLLTSEGFLFGCGSCKYGQLGSGKTTDQTTPVKISEQIRFKDVITNWKNTLSIGVSVDDEYYVWGSAGSTVVLSPELVSDSSKSSVFDIYAKLAAKKITFKAIVLSSDITNQLIPISNQLTAEKNSNPLTDFNDQKNDNNNGLNKCSEELRVEKNSFSYFDYNNEKESIKVESNDCLSQQSVICDNHSIRSSIISSNPMNNLHNCVTKAFNNPKNSDIKFTTEEKTIYCHKTILQIRNEKFWQILSQMMSASNEVHICNEKYDSMYAFLQYLYGIELQFNDNIVHDLQSMAEIFNEKDLLDECSQHIEAIENTPNMSNVCALYQKAIKQGLTDLENSCLEFASNNWKLIFRSDEFEAMDDSLSKRLIVSVFTVEI